MTDLYDGVLRSVARSLHSQKEKAVIEISSDEESCGGAFQSTAKSTIVIDISSDDDVCVVGQCIQTREEVVIIEITSDDDVFDVGQCTETSDEEFEIASGPIPRKNSVPNACCEDDDILVVHNVNSITHSCNTQRIVMTPVHTGSNANVMSASPLMKRNTSTCYDSNMYVGKKNRHDTYKSVISTMCLDLTESADDTSNSLIKQEYELYLSCHENVGMYVDHFVCSWARNNDDWDECNFFDGLRNIVRRNPLCSSTNFQDFKHKCLLQSNVHDLNYETLSKSFIILTDQIIYLPDAYMQTLKLEQVVVEYLYGKCLLESIVILEKDIHTSALIHQNMYTWKIDMNTYIQLDIHEHNKHYVDEIKEFENLFLSVYQ